MISRHDAKVRAVLDEVMQSNGYSGESRFYRSTLPEFITATEDPGLYAITANDDPTEAVVDVYSQGHICLAQQVGPGLAFCESKASEWHEPGRTVVELRLQDVLDQGGCIYPVESIITERVWYFTFPDGHVPVRALE